MEFNSNTEERNEKPEMIPKPTATPSFEESIPLLTEVEGFRLLPNDLMFPKESILAKLKVR